MCVCISPEKGGDVLAHSFARRVVPIIILEGHQLTEGMLPAAPWINTENLCQIQKPFSGKQYVTIITHMD